VAAAFPFQPLVGTGTALRLILQFSKLGRRSRHLISLHTYSARGMRRRQRVGVRSWHA
jgi:hypothetical protein